MKRLLTSAVCVAALLLAAGCKRGSDVASASGAPAAETAAPVQPAITVTVAATVPTCSDAVHGGGQFQPITHPDNLGFSWSPVKQPAATRYAMELGRYQQGSSAPAILASRVLKAEDKLEVMAGERSMGNSYRIRVVAYDGADKPICVVGGVNGLAPQG